MSSTNRGGERRTLDRYYTPDAVAEACLQASSFSLPGALVIEPSVGRGAFARAALREGAAGVLGIDLDISAADHAGSYNFLHGDFLSIDTQAFDYIVGNPPFGQAEAHVRHALALARMGVGFLLRLSFLETAKRRAFWIAHPPKRVLVLRTRPSFTDGGNDSCAYAWFEWDLGAENTTPTLGWIDWK